MGNKNSKSMSGSYSMKGTAPAGVTRVKKGSHTTNGNGPPPLSYPSDPPDDINMNEIIEENVELTVLLPDGSTKHQSVESNIPMMDLLINLAASNKLSPTSHTLVVLTGDKWKQIDFKANKTIGLFAGEDRQVSVQVVKKKTEEKVKTRSTTQPFEMTYRFTVNLPQNQKKVLRISPKLTLTEVRQMVCTEKGFDPSGYAFILPSSPTDSLDDATTVGELKTSEINFVSIAMVDAAKSKSLPDLAFAASMSVPPESSKTAEDARGYMPSTGEKKAKRGFLSFLGKKDKKFKVQGSMDSGTLKNPPKKSESFNVQSQAQRLSKSERPQTMYTDSSELDHFNLRRTTGNLQAYSNSRTDLRKSSPSALLPVSENLVLSTKNDSLEQKSVQQTTSKKKKRAAPPPPQAIKSQTVQVEIEVTPKQTEEAKIEDLSTEIRVPLKKMHSRNSSDSSGYHELTLNGAESPDSIKLDNLQTTIDTTSIDSAEHFNGETEIHDMSPSRRRRSNNKVPREINSRDSSLDMDRPEGVIAPGRKKKRAPLPPPGMSVCSIIVSNDNSQDAQGSPRVESGTRNVDKTHKDEEFAALQAMEEVTMKFNIDDSDEEEDDGMRMIEDASINSEDVDIDVAHRQRPPATFVAPPPPLEPPPDDSEPVDITTVTYQADTIDIGVGEDTTSLGPGSSKSSPKSIHSRRDSGSSSSSVNTLEDLSLAFKQTIAMGEEALGLDSDLDNDYSEYVQDELKQAMPAFKEQISKLASEEAEVANSSNRTEQSEQGTDSDASFIVHETDVVKDTASEASFDMSQSKPTEGNRESSEITYEFTIDSVPPDFQNHGEQMSEDEFIETEEIVEIFSVPIRPETMELGSPRRIPDLDSPKEHRTFSLPPRELYSDIPIDNSTPKNSREDAKNLKQEEESELKEKEANKVKEKEEFVISLDELSNIDFSAHKPGEQKKERKVSSDVPKVNYRIAFRSSCNFDEEPQEEYIQSEFVSNVNQGPVFDESQNNEDDSERNGVKTKCSDISFSPSSEGEVEHVLEEKSISMINLPAERTPVKQTQQNNDSESDHAEDVNINPSRTYASSTQITLSQSSPSPSLKSDISPRKDDTFETQNLMQTHYQQLQQQFTMWQNQLIQNQNLLASQAAPDVSSTNQMAAAGADDQSNLQLQQLQLQIQMQQQMLLQLQQSMTALTLQNTLTAQPFQNQTLAQPAIVPMATVQTPMQTVQTLSKESEKNRAPSPVQAYPQNQIKVLPPQEPPVAPAPPPTVSSKPKASKVDAKYSKPKQKKFERQLDPRERMMLDIRNFGKGGLKKVPVKATHWHK